MTDLINGRTPEEIIEANRHCSRCFCDECAYFNAIECQTDLKRDCADLIKHLEAKQPKWISVKERLPPPETKIYLIASNDPNGERIVKTSVWAWDENSKKGDWINWNVVTHWMPLPEPPKEETHETTD